MRGSKAKEMRRHVRENYKFLSDETVYTAIPCFGRDGREKAVIKVGSACKRHLYRYMKKQYLAIKRAA